MSTFIDAMLNAGIVTRDPIIDDGVLHRFHVEGDKRGTKNGAYILFSNGGWFQHWNSGVTGKWSANGKNAPLSKEIRAQKLKRIASSGKLKCSNAMMTQQRKRNRFGVMHNLSHIIHT